MIPDHLINQAKGTDILSLVPGELRKVSTHDGGEYAGPCPFCGGADRFRVWPASGRYWCRGHGNNGSGCGKRGDVIDLIMNLENLTFTEAVNRLTGQAGQSLPTQTTQYSPSKRKNPDHSTWERRAREFVNDTMSSLKPRGLAYLERRGLDAITAYGAGLGWNQKPIKNDGELWGLTGEVHLGAGLVIPYELWGRIVAINIRTDQGYRIIKGSKLSHDGKRIIYRPCPWAISEAVILFEGEFDALAAWQALGSAAVGVGSIPAGNLTSLDDLGGRPCWVCFDTDQAGKAAAQAAADMGAGVISLPEQFKDFNDYSRAVGDQAAGEFLRESMT